MNITTNREIKTAVFGILAIILFIWGYNFLKGKDILKNYHTFYAVFDNVDGIDESTPVKLKGLNIGNISRMKFINGDQKILLTINIDSDYFIPKDSRVKIEGSGILGSKNLVLDPGFSPEPAKDGDTLQSSTEQGLTEIIGNTKEQLDQLIFNTNRLVKNFNSILNDTNKNNLKQSIANINALTRKLNKLTETSQALVEENRKTIRETLNSFDQSGKNIEKITGQLAKKDWEQLLENLTKSTENLNNILKDLQSGKGTLGKLSKDERLYNELNSTLQSLNALLTDLKQHPKRYVHFSVFGRKDKKNQ